MMILAYIGPETTLPIASALVAAVGFILAGGRALIARVVGIFRRPAPAPDPAPRPLSPNARTSHHGDR